VWLYREGAQPKLIGWEHTEIILEVISPDITDVPSHNQLIKSYRDNPNYPEQLSELGFLGPLDIIKKRCQEEPEVKDDIERLRIGNLLREHSRFKTCGHVGRIDAVGLHPQQYPVANYTCSYTPKWASTFIQMVSTLMMLYIFASMCKGLANSLVRSFS
jgi:hypothetical protein